MISFVILNLYFTVGVASLSIITINYKEVNQWIILNCSFYLYQPTSYNVTWILDNQTIATFTKINNDHTNTHNTNINRFGKIKTPFLFDNYHHTASLSVNLTAADDHKVFTCQVNQTTIQQFKILMLAPIQAVLINITQTPDNITCLSCGASQGYPLKAIKINWKGYDNKNKICVNESLKHAIKYSCVINHTLLNQILIKTIQLSEKNKKEEKNEEEEENIRIFVIGIIVIFILVIMVCVTICSVCCCKKKKKKVIEDHRSNICYYKDPIFV
nr:ORF111A [Acipenserid herpesvirus 1]